jgi:hypothetical protein
MQHPSRTLRILIIGASALTLSVGSARAQTTRSVGATSDLLHAPDGRALATVVSGASVQTHESRAGFTRVTLRGFVDTSFLGARRDSFAQSIRGQTGTVRLRARGARSAPIVAELYAGMGLSRVTRNGAWAQIERSGWIRTNALTGAGTRELASVSEKQGPGTSELAPPTSLIPDSTARPEGALTPARPTDLRSAPDGTPVASARPGTIVTPLARERGWVRVRVEGWIPERDLVPADSAMRSAPSAADLRADPEGSRGRTVSWVVQVLALQHADPLRRDMAPDEPYLLARGPGTESSLVYLAVPPSLLATARSIPPLTKIAVTARVRNGRSEPVGVPILDLMRIVQQ